MQKEYNTNSTFIKSLDYIKCQMILSFKSLREYKANFFLGIFSTIMFTLIGFVFVFAIETAFRDILDWSFKEYFFFIIIHGFTVLWSAMFWFDLNLDKHILSGSINAYLTKPINPFIQYLFSVSHIFLAAGELIYTPMLIYFLIFVYIDYTFVILLKLALFVFLNIIFYISVYRMLESIAFFFKNSKVFFKFYNSYSNTFDRYPAIIFNQSKFLYFFVFLSVNAYSGTFATEILFNNISSQFYWLLIKILFSLSMICIFILILNWKIGLKKYEGFGG